MKIIKKQKFADCFKFCAVNVNKLLLSMLKTKQKKQSTAQIVTAHLPSSSVSVMADV